MHDILFYYTPQSIRMFTNTEIGSKIIKKNLRQTLGKDIGKEIKLSSRKTQLPEVERRVSGQPPQSVSVQDKREETWDLYSCSPWSRVPLIH